MADKDKPRDIRTMINQFRTSDHWAVSLARDLLWVVAVVGCIALALFLICGTWPAVVTIESESMVPNMNAGDLVVVVQKDRFGDLQTWDDGKKSGYKKFCDYGDVIIYRPNGITDMWASVGILPFSKQHPIIHRAMIWTEAGQPVPSYLNTYRGRVTPADYLPLTVSGQTANGYTILSTGTASQVSNYTSGSKDLIMKTPQGNYVLPEDAVIPNSGYVRDTDTTATNGGYITKGDNNYFSDQGYLTIPGTGTVGPVAKEWVIGKALFTVPYVGLLPLHIVEVIVVIIIIMVLHEFYLRRKWEETTVKPQKKSGKKQR
ncbi:MAG: S26 family signal peptidase [Methanoregula sp.]|nr:S26 family signal peptidase [Methanoregula sp.]